MYDHGTEFAGLPVADINAGPAGDHAPLEGPMAWRVGTHYDGPPFDEVFDRFLDQVDTSRVTALVVGYWGGSYDEGVVDPVAVLCGAADRLPNLRALFLGDIEPEEAEISWIRHSDISPLLVVFPGLERLEVRGHGGLELKPFRSDTLKVLRFEAGGFDRAVVRAVTASDLPVLERLDLWLGSEDWGADTTMEDLAPILGGKRLPALRHLGLENSDLQDEIAVALAGAPVVARLECLSLAMGVLSDQGAEALLAGQPLTHLKWLDLHDNYLSDQMTERVRAAPPGVEIDLSWQEDADEDDRYVTVSE